MKLANRVYRKPRQGAGSWSPWTSPTGTTSGALPHASQLGGTTTGDLAQYVPSTPGHTCGYTPKGPCFARVTRPREQIGPKTHGATRGEREGDMMRRPGDVDARAKEDSKGSLRTESCPAVPQRWNSSLSFSGDSSAERATEYTCVLPQFVVLICTESLSCSGLCLAARALGHPPLTIQKT